MPQEIALDRPSLAQTAARQVETRKPELAERIWSGVDRIANVRLQEARLALSAQGYTDADDMTAIRLAYAQHLHSVEVIDPEEMSTSSVVANQLALVLLDIPSAAEAQHLDRTELSSRKRTERAATLARFNGHIVDALTYMPKSMASNLLSSLMTRQEGTARRFNVPSFSESEMAQCLAGLRREVGFARALTHNAPQGWHIRHATPEEDAKGIDFIVQVGDRRLNIDVKSEVAYANLIEKKTYPPTKAEAMLSAGYFRDITTTPQGQPIERLIVDADALGEIRGFEYDDPIAVVDFVEAHLAQRQSVTLRRLGHSAITR